MIRALIITFLRNLRKNKLFSVINILGFTLGISSVILILLFVFSELSYDRYNDKADRIYRLCIKAMIGNTPINQTWSSARNFREMKARYPEIENGVKLVDLDNAFVRAGERTFTEPSVIFADSTLFEVFTLPMVAGDFRNPLNAPNTIVLSQTGAQKYFGDADPVGKDLEMDIPYFGKRQFKVTAVMKDIPSTSHFHFDMVGALVSFPGFINSDGWSNNNFKSYYLHKPGASAKDLEAKFKDYVIESFGAKNYESYLAKGNSWEFYLQPLTSIHLNSDLNGEFEPNGNIRYIYIFSIIAFFVLVIACINFMNLSTAKSLRRAREVGIRKVSGSTRGQLIIQFLSESMILALASMALALLTVKLILPWFSDWLNRDLSFSLLGRPWMIVTLISMVVIIGILAAFYPAMVLTSFQPARVLKAQSVDSKKGLGLRNALVIVQFGATIFLIIGTLSVNRQLQYIQNTDTGYTKNNLLVIHTPPSFASVSQPFIEEIRHQPGVSGITASSSLPGFDFSNLGCHSELVDKPFTLNIFTCDPDFCQTLGMTMAKGRFFSRDFPTDSSAMVLNETAVRVLGLKEPIGSKISLNQNPPVDLHVIGVIRDFNYESARAEIRPMALIFQGNVFNQSLDFATVRFTPGSRKSVTEAVRSVWNRFMPETPFRYSYLEDDYNEMYHNEIQTGQVFTLLALLTLVVAIMGLLGLASYLAQQRTREIAVRKVFGAGMARIMGLLTWKFTRLVLIAFVLTCPVAWWVMHKWLENFVYRIPMDVWIFFLSGAAALLISTLTINLIVWKAASANPADGLKYE
jgi:putative ABC transport system permease protein